MRLLRKLSVFALVLVFIFATYSMPAVAARKTYIAPNATNVTISGSAVAGQKLAGSYTYNDASGVPEGTSTYAWLYSTSLTGTYYPISGATAKTYTIAKNDAGHYIKFQVMPAAAWGKPDTGTPVQSPAAGPVAVPVGSAPTVSNVAVGGNTTVGQVLTGSYTYYDADGDLEGASSYRWLSASSQTGTFSAISGANGKTYMLTSSDAGNYIKFEVTPVSAAGSPNTGIPVQSQAAGPVTNPVAASRTVLGFAVKYYSTDVSSYNSMVNNTKSIDQIATVTYTTDSYGNLSGTVPADQVSYANSNGVKPLALVSNSDSSGFNSSIAKSVLESPTYSQALINNLVNTIRTNGYKGVNIDIEGVPNTDRTYYTQFVTNVKNALSPLGYLTTISVPAETVDSPTNSWNGAFDYAALGKIADEVLIMSYDEHGTWTTPGPVASIGWVTGVADYAKTVIPVNKILLGLAAYGYDWSSAGNKALSLNQIDSLVATYKGSVQWDAASESPYYIYTDTSGVQHTIWFENYDSIGYKCDLVNQNDLEGIGIWRLGLEDAAYWGIINTKFGK